MFKYDKVIGKLERFSDLSSEKQMKLLKKVVSDDEYLEWQFDPGKDHAAYSNEMVAKFYHLLAKPAPMRVYPKMLDYYGGSKFTRDSAVVLNAILTFALRTNAEMVETIRAEVNEHGNSVEVQEMRRRAAKYTERIDDLRDAIQDLVKPIVKTISKNSGLGKDMAFRALMVAPSPQYIAKHRITPLVMQVLAELYEEAGMSGFPSRGSKIDWSSLFVAMFGVENTAEVAVNILLEGIHHIDKYRDSKNLNLGAIRDCWDSLTVWALNQMEHCSDDAREQMLKLYIKKAENMITRRNGRPTDMRVNLTKLGREFRNLTRTVDMYRDQFNTLLSKVRFGPNARSENDQRRESGSDTNWRDSRSDYKAEKPKDDFPSVQDETVPINEVFPAEEDDKPSKKKKDFDLGSSFKKAVDLTESIADTLARIAGDDEEL